MFDTEPFVARSAPSCLDLVRNEQSTVLLGYLVDAGEIFLWRNDKAANAEDRLSHKSSDLAGRSGLDQFLDVVSARKSAIVWCRVKRAAIAIRGECVNKSGDL